jgi:pyrroloquinoline quinone (PQQ) biosynthesis protein C
MEASNWATGAGASAILERPAESVAARDPKQFVDALMSGTRENFRRYALGHPLMTELAAGVLSIEQVRGFFLNWYTWVFEINMATAVWLHRFGPILKRHPEIAEVVNDKIADELATPTRRGHIETLERVAAAVGLTRDELVNARLIPEARAWLDYFVRLQMEGTFAECVAGYLGEGCFPEFAAVFEKALEEHYGVAREDLEYFRLHGELDVEHGEGNVFILQRLVETGQVEERPGWGIDYVLPTGGQMFVMFLDGVYRRYRPATA